MTNRIDGDTTASWDLQNCTITGTSGANWFRVAHESDCELVGGTFDGFLIKNHGYGVLNLEDFSYTFKDLENPQPFLSFKITDIIDIEKEKEILTND